MTFQRISSCFATSLGFLFAGASGQAAVGGGMTESGQQAALLLAVLFAVLGAELRRRVQAGMWSSREKAFFRRTAQVGRRARSGRAL